MTEVASNTKVEQKNVADQDDFLTGLESILAEANDENENEVLALRAAAW